jgi:hypothetical protein
MVLQSQVAPAFPGLNAAPYQGPPGLWQNDESLRQTRVLADLIVDAVNELYALQERNRKRGKRSAVPATTAQRPALPVMPNGSPKPLVSKTFKLRRGKRTTRIRLKLSRKAVTALRRRASRKNNAVAVRLVVSFRAKPRPIVRFVDFRLPVKASKARKKQRR